MGTLDKSLNMLGRVSCQRGFCAENIMPQLRTGKYHIIEHIEDHIGRRVFVGINLIYNNFTLLIQFAFGECGVECHVGNKLYGLRKVATQGRSVYCRILFCCVGVKLATKIFQTAIYLICFTMRCTFEKCVLGKVRQAKFIL